MAISSLHDYLNKLSEQVDDSGTIYSEPVVESKEESTKVQEDAKKEPVTFTIKIKPKVQTAPKQITIRIRPLAQKQNTCTNMDTCAIIKKDTDEEVAEKLFVHSETEEKNKKIWFDVYNKAQSSKKDNRVANALKAGQFMIINDGQIFLLSKYDVFGKSSNDIINDTWLHN